MSDEVVLQKYQINMVEGMPMKIGFCLEGEPRNYLLTNFVYMDETNETLLVEYRRGDLPTDFMKSVSW